MCTNSLCTPDMWYRRNTFRKPHPGKGIGETGRAEKTVGNLVTVLLGPRSSQAIRPSSSASPLCVGKRRASGSACPSRPRLSKASPPPNRNDSSSTIFQNNKRLRPWWTKTPEEQESSILSEGTKPSSRRRAAHPLTLFMTRDLLPLRCALSLCHRRRLRP
jgi:hypothetical protein